MTLQVVSQVASLSGEQGLVPLPSDSNRQSNPLQTALGMDSSAANHKQSSQQSLGLQLAQMKQQLAASKQAAELDVQKQTLFDTLRGKDLEADSISLCSIAASSPSSSQQQPAGA